MAIKLFIAKHAIQRMFERSISEEDVVHTIENGVIIKKYEDDKPYPSMLAYSIANKQPLHVVFSVDDSNKKEKNYLVITVYRPSLEEWNSDYKTRRANK